MGLSDEIKFKRARRKTIVLCDDVECYFKQTSRTVNGLANECALDLDKAMRFYKKYGITTCEAGMCQGMVHKSRTEHFKVLKSIKYSKYKYKGGDGVE
jgi:NADH:ubiquinone oxidoreductase subunit E